MPIPRLDLESIKRVVDYKDNKGLSYREIQRLMGSNGKLKDRKTVIVWYYVGKGWLKKAGDYGKVKVKKDGSGKLYTVNKQNKDLTGGK